MRARHVILASLLALCVPAAASAEASPPPPNPFLRGIALLQEEAALLPLAGPAQRGDPAFAANRGRLAFVDASGAAILARLHAAGIRTSPVLARTLDRLPPPVAGGPPPPRPREYHAAIVELKRLAIAHRGNATLEPAGPPSAGPGWVTLGLAGLVGALAACVAVIAHRQRTGRAQPRDDLRAIALIDPLTGTGNRRKLDEDVTRHELAAAPSQVSVLMIDVDNFKDVNDRHGHPVGDEVLRHVGRVLQARTRTDGDVYRYGGEEFCVVLRETPLEAAQAVADRLRSSLATASMPAGLQVTISIGVATGSSHEIAVVIRHADAALYDAKHAGRDTVRTFTTLHRRDRTAPRVELGPVAELRG